MDRRVEADNDRGQYLHKILKSFHVGLKLQ